MYFIVREYVDGSIVDRVDFVEKIVQFGINCTRVMYLFVLENGGSERLDFKGISSAVNIFIPWRRIMVFFWIVYLKALGKGKVKLKGLW